MLFVGTIYEKKWSGLCFNGQKDLGQRLTNVPFESCRDMCTQDPHCIGYAINPNDVCWITKENERMEKWNDTSNGNAVCYQKIRGN